MSAFIVDYKTIDNILSIRLNQGILLNYCYLKSEFDTLFEKPGDYWIFENLENLGKEFLRLNIESVNTRYPDDDKINMPMDYAENYKFKNIDFMDLGQAIKSLDCLMYQSCEIDNFKENPTYQKMEKLRNYLVQAFLNLSDDYRLAKWSDTY